IAWPSPTIKGTSNAHGATLGREELLGLKRQLGINNGEMFQVPAEVLEHTRLLRNRGEEAHQVWNRKFASWRERNPNRAELFDRILSGRKVVGWDDDLPDFHAGTPISTREASGKVLDAVGSKLPELWGGSADLSEATHTLIR